MSKPIGHTEEYVRLVIDQLEAEFPNASPEIIRAAAKCKVEFYPRRDRAFLRLVKG